MSAPTERERLARLIYKAGKERVPLILAEYLAEVVLEDGFHCEGAPRTPAPTEDLPPIKITAEVHCQCGTDFERDFTVEPATLRTAIDYARKQLAGRGEGET